MPEFAAPGIGRSSNKIVIDLEVGEDTSGVLYALGGISGGLTLFLDKGKLVYEYNMMMIERYIGGPEERVARGKHTIEVDTVIAKPGGPGLVELMIDGKVAAQIDLKRTVPAAFTASETFDVGTDLGSPVSFEYFDRRPFRFDGAIEKVDVQLQ